MSLGPAEVHPEEHLRPVGCLGAAGPGTDRQEGASLVVLPREEQLRPLPLEIALERCGLAIELSRQLRIIRFLDELEGREDVGGAPIELGPECGFRSQAIGFAQNFLGGALVVPEARLACLGLERGDALDLGV
jgi:hypothetical protein